MTVMVLMSTYNGEEFLEEQIESILNQTGVEVSLKIRDDGSSDSTVSIIEKYEEKDYRISHYVGDNLGPGKSFFDLIKNASGNDYYAFSDQDDVWDPNKLESAINKLEQCDKSVPCLYYSNLRLVDRNKIFIRNAYSKPIKEGKKYSALANSTMTGCTAVFNNAAKELISEHIPSDNMLHDGWVYVVCKLFGQVVYDHTPHISYRQHEHNVVGMGNEKRTEVLEKRVRRIFDSSRQPRLKRAICIKKVFEKELAGKNLEKVNEVINYKKSIRNKCRLLFDNEICELSLKGDLRYRFLIVLGKI